jgi:DUF4097 and DUF4098 domain-containing protein YvlB
MGIGRVAAAAATGIIGLGLLVGCGDWNTDSYSDADGVGQSFSSVRFTNDSGDVTIRTGDKAEVRRTVHYRDDKPGDTFRVKDGVLELDSCDKHNCRIDYEVTVPAGTRVSGELDSGTVDISGVAEANVRASSGEVNVKDVAGAVNIEADSGSMTLEKIGGPVVAKADSGNVEVELANAADVRVGADSGNIDVTVPDGSYKVSTSTDSGNVDSDIDDDPAGEHVIDLHADSGNVRVSAA